MWVDTSASQRKDERVRERERERERGGGGGDFGKVDRSSRSFCFKHNTAVSN